MTALLTPRDAHGRHEPPFGYRHVVSSPLPLDRMHALEQTEPGGSAPYVEVQDPDVGESTTRFLADLMKPGEFERRAEATTRDDRPSLLAEVMIPEDTFRPHALGARIVDSSHRGIKLYLEGMRKDLYRRMIHKQRHVRLTYGSGSEAIRITGRITWFAFHESPAQRMAARTARAENRPLTDLPEGNCFCFVTFDGRETDGGEALGLFLRALAR